MLHKDHHYETIEQIQSFYSKTTLGATIRSIVVMKTPKHDTCSFPAERVASRKQLDERSLDQRSVQDAVLEEPVSVSQEMYVAYM